MLCQTPIDRLHEVLTFRLNAGSNSTKLLYGRMEKERKEDWIKVARKLTGGKKAA